MAESDPVRVMVIDDQSDVRFLVGLIVGDHDDLELVAEADGAESALAAIAEAAPDVTLLDARMPIVDGFELAPQLIARFPAMRIVLLTSIVDDVIREQARAAGAHACASKADFDTLPDLIRELAAR